MLSDHKVPLPLVTCDGGNKTSGEFKGTCYPPFQRMEVYCHMDNTVCSLLSLRGGAAVEVVS